MRRNSKKAVTFMNVELLHVNAPKSTKNVNLDKDALFAVGAEMVKNGCTLIRECGGKADPVEQLCAITGISKRILAYAYVINGCTAKEIQDKLNVSSSTIYREWPEVARALRTKRSVLRSNSDDSEKNNVDFLDE